MECRLKDFNPNELPSSLKHLNLRDNFLETFELTKPLINLVSLDLGQNSLTRFILDMKDLLPKINSVHLGANKIIDFQPIDNASNQTLEIINLDINQIRNMNAYEWILHNKKVLTRVSCFGNFPVCDCNFKTTLDNLFKQKIVQNCILPVPGELQIDIKTFECPANDIRESFCPLFTGLFKKKFNFSFVNAYFSNFRWHKTHDTYSQLL